MILVLPQVVSCNAHLLSQELLRQNQVSEYTASGQRFASVMEILVKEMIHTRENEARQPSDAHTSVSMVSLQASKEKRRHLVNQVGLNMGLPRYTTAALVGNKIPLRNQGDNPDLLLTAAASGSKETIRKTRLTRSTSELSNKEIFSVGHGGGHPAGGEAACNERKERCKTRSEKKAATTELYTALLPSICVRSFWHAP